MFDKEQDARFGAFTNESVPTWGVNVLDVTIVNKGAQAVRMAASEI